MFSKLVLTIVYLFVLGIRFKSTKSLKPFRADTLYLINSILFKYV